jgi:hypothetical protein
LECVWEFDVEISYKEVAYSCMWVAPYSQYCIWHWVSTTIVATCSITLKAIQIPWIVSVCYNWKPQLQA